MAKLADYRPHLPGPEHSRIAGEDAETHTRGRLALPRAAGLFQQWGELVKQPFRGVTTDGVTVSGLYGLRDEGAPTADMAEKTAQLLTALTPVERERGSHDVDSPLWRMWQNTEMFVETHGLRLEHLTAAKRDMVLAVLRASLSSGGYDTAIGAMQLNGFLGSLIGAPEVLGEWSYNFCLFGQPSLSEPWGWQLWGHHLAISCLVIGGQMVLTPCFVGAEICYADEGPYKGVTLFQDEERLGLDLFNALAPRDQSAARVGFDLAGSDLPEGRVHFADYLTLGGAHQDNRIVPMEGARVDRFSAAQRSALLDLVNAYVGALPDGPRQAKVEDVERHLADTHFCWIGGNGPNDPFYYRVQSPVVFIEFDHHPGLFLTNDTPKKFHVHTVVRSPNGNDYGKDVLRQHYANSDDHKHSHGHDHGHSHD
ncbi:MAG: DUF3500 domain-containing protein [Marinibacterium sp.]|nr:DUF3500 domain-containing protein [Marinibacterium sp.]